MSTGPGSPQAGDRSMTQQELQDLLLANPSNLPPGLFSERPHHAQSNAYFQYVSMLRRIPELSAMEKQIFREGSTFSSPTPGHDYTAMSILPDASRFGAEDLTKTFAKRHASNQPRTAPIEKYTIGMLEPFLDNVGARVSDCVTANDYAIRLHEVLERQFDLEAPMSGGVAEPTSYHNASQRVKRLLRKADEGDIKSLPDALKTIDILRDHIFELEDKQRGLEMMKPNLRDAKAKLEALRESMKDTRDAVRFGIIETQEELQRHSRHFEEVAGIRTGPGVSRAKEVELMAIADRMRRENPLRDAAGVYRTALVMLARDAAGSLYMGSDNGKDQLLIPFAPLAHEGQIPGGVEALNASEPLSGVPLNDLMAEMHSDPYAHQSTAGDDLTDAWGPLEKMKRIPEGVAPVLGVAMKLSKRLRAVGALVQWLTENRASLQLEIEKLEMELQGLGKTTFGGFGNSPSASMRRKGSRAASMRRNQSVSGLKGSASRKSFHARSSPRRASSSPRSAKTAAIGVQTEETSMSGTILGSLPRRRKSSSLEQSASFAASQSRNLSGSKRAPWLSDSKENGGDGGSDKDEEDPEYGPSLEYPFDWEQHAILGETLRQCARNPPEDVHTNARPLLLQLRAWLFPDDTGIVAAGKAARDEELANNAELAVSASRGSTPMTGERRRLSSIPGGSSSSTGAFGGKGIDGSPGSPFGGEEGAEGAEGSTTGTTEPTVQPHFTIPDEVADPEMPMPSYIKRAEDVLPEGSNPYTIKSPSFLHPHGTIEGMASTPMDQLRRRREIRRQQLDANREADGGDASPLSGDFNRSSFFGGSSSHAFAGSRSSVVDSMATSVRGGGRRPTSDPHLQQVDAKALLDLRAALHSMPELDELSRMRTGQELRKHPLIGSGDDGMPQRSSKHFLFAPECSMPMPPEKEPGEQRINEK